MSLAPPIATTDQLAMWMREPWTGDEEEQADLILRVVSAWVRTIGGKQWGIGDVGTPDDVVGVVLSASRREWDNPDRYITESMGPLSVTRAQPPRDFFTPGELRVLVKRSGNNGLFTVSTKREESGWSTGYLHMREDLSDEAFPYLNYGEPGWDETIHL